MYQLSPINVKRFYTVTLCLIAFTLPLSVSYNSMLLIVLALVWIAEGRWGRKWEIARSNRWVFLFSFFFIWHVAGLAYSQDIAEGLHELEKKASLLLFPLVLGTATIQRRGITIKVIWSFVAANFLAAVACLVGGLYRYSKGIPPSSSVYGGHDATLAFRKAHTQTSAIWEYITYTELTTPVKIHPTYFSLYILFSLVFLFYTLLKSYRAQEKMDWKKGGMVFLLLFFSGFLFLLSSRIAIVMYVLCLISMPVAVFYKRLNKVKLIALIASLILVTSILVAQIPVVQHRFLSDLKMFTEGTVADNPGTGMYQRLNIWRTSVTLIKAEPLTGVGTGDAQLAFDAEYARLCLELCGLNAHNQFLQTAITLGLPAMLLLLLFFIVPFRFALRDRDILYAYFLLLVFTASLTEAMLQRHKGIVFYALFNALLFFYKYGSKTEELLEEKPEPKKELH
ncbi:O-antigen ligase family protein [Pontibacter sp. KCTC 32443]|uniref:O-antigen ligase family protein n=1 Tax=Pontibacter TaxID=323449 RepID=UPI00164DFF8C|nr:MULTISPECIES: O-antigen ligase family protein [Pontibacter]MBC5774893.1 O-antigen ligase family protein [Pontibacter sp. KCTC 32443]